MRRSTAVAALLVFAGVFVALERNAYTRHSATWDEPIHLTSGYAALARGDHRIDPSHPPLLRMWAALPLLVDGPDIATGAIDRFDDDAWLPAAYGFAQTFLYDDNDADGMLYRARFMIVLLGALLGSLLFCWVREWFGAAPAVVALALFTMEPNLAAHASLVTTDLGVTCFIFGAIYFLWRASRAATAANLAGVAVMTALAIAAKFSALALLPMLAVLVALLVGHGRIGARTALGLAAAIGATTVGTLWIVYGMRYAPSESSGWLFDGQRNVIDTLGLLPNAFTQGLLYSRNSLREAPAFLAGEYSTQGWWYYFPFAFAIKTPLTVLALFAIGLALLWRRRADALNRFFVTIPIVIYLAMAMASGINIGVRHILPIYPFVLLAGAAAIAALLAQGRRGQVAAGVLVLAAAVEFGTAYPHNLAFFNQLVGGPANGYRYLTDSNLGWGQNLKPLKAWMDRNGVQHINLAYFGQADPDYYMIDATFLPGGPSFAIDRIMRPRLPGYVAISSTVLSGVYLQPQWRLFYRPFVQREPVAVIGNSMRVYWVDRWPETVAPDSDASEADAHRALADVLLIGQQWPTRALRHYRHYLKYRPYDQDVMINAAAAMLSTGETAEAILLLRRAVDTAPANGHAHLALGRALLAGRDVTGAASHAEQAVALMPGEPGALDLLGRVRAVQGRLMDAATLFRRALERDPERATIRALLERVEAALAAMPRID